MIRVPGRTVSAAIAVALSVAPAARAEVGPLHVSPGWDLAVTGTTLALSLALSTSRFTPTRCAACGFGELDEAARDSLAWKDPAAARHASDLLANAVIPAAALANSFVFSRRGGEPSAFWADALVLAEVVGVSTGLDAISKDAVARRRPSASVGARGAADESFYSGHTSLSFALAAGAGTISTLRGYPSAPWVWTGGMGLASAVGYLRVAGDAHWATDVLAGAAAGGLVGFGVPWLFHRVAPSHAVDLVPTPGGVGVRF